MAYKKSPFKMMPKSPMLKALIGNQKNLNEGLKQAILDSPAKMAHRESPSKMAHKSPSKMAHKESPAKKYKSSPMKQKMEMVTVNGKKVPKFAADGKGAGDLKKASPAKGYKSAAQRKAVHASKADGGAGHPDKKKSPAKQMSKLKKSPAKQCGGFKSAAKMAHKKSPAKMAHKKSPAKKMRPGETTTEYRNRLSGKPSEISRKLIRERKENILAKKQREIEKGKKAAADARAKVKAAKKSPAKQAKTDIQKLRSGKQSEIAQLRKKYKTEKSFQRAMNMQAAAEAKKAKKSPVKKYGKSPAKAHCTKK
jgi:hypothetical protein